VYPGDAAQVLENETVKVRSLKTDLIGEQRIGGWVVMPREHFEILARKAGYESK
jgi:cephalosporin-C deacetylase-like acetyl esterase